MSMTADNKRYTRGMTLYSVVPNMDGPFVSEHIGSYPNGVGRWQTDGSPGCAGRINDCYSTERAAIEAIIRRYDSQIRALETKRTVWTDKLGKLRP